MIVFPHDLPLVHGPNLTAELAGWAAARIPHAPHGFDPCWAVGVVRRKRLAAVVVFHLYDPETGTVCVSCAADTPAWASRRVVGAILRAGFDGLGAPMRRIWTMPPITNERAVRFNLGIGFRREGVVNHHYAHGAHGQMLGMMRAYFEQRYGEMA